MKFTKRILVLLAAMTAANSVCSQEPARLTAFCTSLLFGPGTGGPGQVITVRMTSDSNFGEINGEVRPLFDPALPTHGALFLMEDPTFPDSLAGQIAFDTPQAVDQNEDGFDDFFQVAQAVESVTTQGFFETPVDIGLVTATWSRAAGAVSGTCQLELVGETFGELPTVTHTFQVLEYRGTLAYTVTTNGITGTLEMEQTEQASETLSGLISASRVETNRFNWVDIRAGNLTNATGQPLSHRLIALERDEVTGTNYFGFLDFTDGNLATGTEDFLTWVLSIDDPNDTDGDGIPDFSDDPVQAPQTGPVLGISKTGETLAISIRGEIGRSYQIEETPSLSPASWTSGLALTLTNEIQVVNLNVPEGTSRFWRVRAGNTPGVQP